MKILIGLFLISWNSFAHQTWVSTSDYSPKVGDVIKIEIGNGHRFLKSEMSLPKSIIYSFTITLPSQKKINLQSKKRSSFRQASYKIAMPGIYYIDLELRRPGMDRSAAVARAVISVGITSVKVMPDRKNLSLEFDEESNHLKLWNEERLISGRINVESSAGELYKISVSKKRNGKVHFKKGIYMLTTSKSGQQCSLTFQKR